MKKKVSFFVLIFALGTILSGQKVEDHFSRKNAVKFSPIALGFAEFQLSYERYLNDRSTSFLLMPSVFLKDGRDESNLGFQLMGQYRFYLSHKRADKGELILGIHNVGFYAGLYGQYLDYEEDYKENIYIEGDFEPHQMEFHKDISALEGGVLIGVQIDFTKSIVFDIYLGGGVRNSKVDDTGEDVDGRIEYINDYSVLELEYKGVKPKFGLQLGITF